MQSPAYEAVVFFGRAAAMCASAPCSSAASTAPDAYEPHLDVDFTKLSPDEQDQTA